MSTVPPPLQPAYPLEVGAVSEKGEAHDINEDFYHLDPERGLFILADGIGGHPAGEVASRLAVDVLYQALTAPSSGPIPEVLVAALMAAHRAIRDMAEREEACRGMGTTALIGWVRGLTLWTGHVGNSRAYLWREGILRQLTEDHTMLNELRRAHLLPPDPRDWPSPAVLSQSLGSQQPFLSPGLGEWPLRLGDRLLFCSDGVSDILAAEEIHEVVSRPGHARRICEQLARAVRSKDARDDFTAILVKVEPGGEQEVIP